MSLEDAEHLLDVDGLVDGGEVLNDVEAHGLGEGSALADGHDVTLLHVGEGGGDVHGHVAMLLRETAVLGEVLQVVTTHDDGALHLVGDDHRLEDAAADRDVAGEGALLVHVVASDSGLGRLEAQADGLHEAHALGGGLAAQGALAANEDGVLLLVRLLGLRRETRD